MNDSDTERLRTLEIADAARNAITRYCMALDLSDLKMLESAFADNIVMHRSPNQNLIGREAVLAFFADVLTHRVDHRKHFNTNTVVTRTGPETANAQSYFFAFHHDGGQLSVAWGSYRFTTRLDRGTALITELNIDLDIPIAPLSSMLGSAA
jgi:ketosteroid isomerase-like protein